jgi:hypothetical protein
VTDLAEIGRGVVESRPFGVADDPDAADDPGAAANPDAAADSGESMSRPVDALQADLIAGAGAALLLVSLLFLPWFGVDEPVGRILPGAAASGSEGAWHTLTLLRWVMLVAVAVAFVPLLVRPAARWIGLPKRASALPAVIGGLTGLLLGYRVLINLPDPSRVVDQRAGAILGLLGALVITVGGVESMRAHARPAGGSEVRTGRRRASAPPGEPARVHP